MMALYILLVGAAVGIVASQRRMRDALIYVPVGIVGALLGAFASFGDVPFLLRHVYLNSFTVPVMSSAILVAAVWALRKRGGP